MGHEYRPSIRIIALTVLRSFRNIIECKAQRQQKITPSLVYVTVDKVEEDMLHSKILCQ